MTPKPPTVMLLAGETSGDQHGADVARHIVTRLPNVRLTGMGGPQMVAAGVETVAGLDDLAVMGFVEVVGRLGFFRQLEAQLDERLASGGVDLLVLIDYPGFNMRMARAAKRHGVPTLFYIAPQVWAWRAGRAKKLANTVDTLAVILPFEVPIFEAHGGHVVFVGHPLLDHPAPDAMEVLDGAIRPNDPILALMPGSRGQEIRRHLRPMLAAARRVREARPDVQVAVAQADGLPSFDLPAGVVRVRGGRALLARATAAIVKSGTSTLEAALAEVPFVCVYRTHPLTFALAKRLVRLETIALANLVAGRPVVPEFIQDAFEPERVAEATLELLDSSGDRRAEIRAGLADIKHRLGTPGAAGRVADLALALLSKSS